MKPVLSPAEEAFEQYRKVVGAVLAPLAFAALWFMDFPSLSPEAHRLAAVMGAVVVLWMTEALPMPVTAMLAAAACVLLRVAPAKAVFAPFGDPLMFLFIGSFILARAIFLHRLDRRFAFSVLSLPWVGESPGRLLFAFGAVTATLSAFISNTATTAMMFAIGMAILNFLFDPQRYDPATGIRQRYATGMMLMVAFAASLGGLATPIGTPPNLIGLTFIRNATDTEIPFFKWMLIGVPVSLGLYLFTFAMLNFFCSAGVKRLTGARELVRQEKAKLGPWTTGQKSTMIAFAVTVTLWVLPGAVALIQGESSSIYKSLSASLPEAGAALFGMTLLFLLPGGEGRRAINWEEAVRIDWGVVLLYGGGFALGVLSFQTELARAVGEGLTSLLPVGTGWGLLIVATLIAVLTSELTSNTASANMVVPVVIAIAAASGGDALVPALGATFAASLGFMLPVSTPCNAIVYGSGHIPLTRMIRYGVMLDIFGAVLVVFIVRFIAPLVR